jgi:phosphopantothenoylcysteine decarboxylase/phosphopantothenate--cysteine ligase
MGPSNLQAIKGVKTVKIKSSAEMFKEVKKALPVDIAVCAAAVSDYKPILKNENKIKKTNSALTLEMKKTDDILEYLGKNNISRPKLVVGFSAETEDLIYNSKIKIKNKNSDLIIANDVSNKKIGFDSDFNEVTLIEPDGKTNFIKRSKKSFIASAIVEKIVNKLLFYDKNLN